MSDLLTLDCPSCGGELNLSKDMEIFFCPHCGTKHIFKESINGIPTAAMAESMRASGKLSQKQAALMSVEAIEKEIQALKSSRGTLAKPKSVAGYLKFFGMIVLLFSLIMVAVALEVIQETSSDGIEPIGLFPLQLPISGLIISISLFIGGVSLTARKRKKAAGPLKVLDEKIQKLEIELEKNRDIIRKSPLE